MSISTNRANPEGTILSMRSSTEMVIWIFYWWRSLFMNNIKQFENQDVNSNVHIHHGLLPILIILHNKINWWTYERRQLLHCENLMWSNDSKWIWSLIVFRVYFIHVKKGIRSILGPSFLILNIHHVFYTLIIFQSVFLSTWFTERHF